MIICFKGTVVKVGDWEVVGGCVTSHKKTNGGFNIRSLIKFMYMFKDHKFPKSGVGGGDIQYAY